MTDAELVTPGPAPTLPGLELTGSRLSPATSLEREALAHIDALNAAGRLNAGHRLIVGLVVDLARTIGMGAATGKAAGVAMASRQLLDAMDRLPELVPEESGTEWQQVVDALRPPA